MEALAYSKKVVATRVGGIPEAAGGQASLVEPDEIPALAMEMERVLSGEGTENIKDVQAPITWHEAALRTLECYERALKADQRRSPTSDRKIRKRIQVNHLSDRYRTFRRDHELASFLTIRSRSRSVDPGSCHLSNCWPLCILSGLYHDLGSFSIRYPQPYPSPCGIPRACPLLSAVQS